MSLAFGFSIALIGVTSLLLQVVLLRELLTSFFGNELCIAIILLDWLLIVAAGSWLAGRRRRWDVTPAAFGCLQLALSLAVPAVIIFSRALGGRTMFPGEAVSPGHMALLAALAVGPGCLLLGAQFAVACRLLESFDASGRLVSKVYALESLGAVLAGVVFHFILAEHVRPLSIGLGVGLLNAAAGLWLLGVGPCQHQKALESLKWLEAPGDSVSGALPNKVPGSRGRATLEALCAMVAAVCALLLAWPAARDAVDHRSLTLRWREFDLVACRSSRFGNLAVIENDSQVSLFQDGSLLFASDELQASEWAAHLPLLYLERPGSVLMIGAGYPDTVRQVRRHPARALRVIEMDPALVELARQWLPGGKLSAVGAEHLTIGDARAWLAKANETYDAILVNVHDPTTAALNRYYTREFFALAREALSSGGVLAVSLSGHAAYLTSERQVIHAGVFRALKQVFGHVKAVPGYQVRLLATRDPGVLNASVRTLAQRLERRGPGTQFITPFSLQTALSPFALDSYLRTVSPVDVRPNTDLRPVTHYNYLRLWLKQYAACGLRALPIVESAPGLTHWLLLVAITLLALHRSPRCRWRQGRIGVLTAGVGFVLMGVQLVVILGFQALAGYVYHQIGILVALNMGGLAVGGWLGGTGRLRRRPGQATLAAALLTCGFSYGIGGVLGWLTGLPAAAPVALGLFALACGVAAGMAFPLAVSMLGDRAQARSGSLLYAWDLAGGALGAAIVGVVAIPALGLCLAGTLVGNVGLAGLLVAAPECLGWHRR